MFLLVLRGVRPSVVTRLELGPMRRSDSSKRALSELISELPQGAPAEEVAEDILTRPRLLGAALYERREYQATIVGMVDAGATADQLLAALDFAGVVEPSRMPLLLKRLLRRISPRRLHYGRALRLH